MKKILSITLALCIAALCSVTVAAEGAPVVYVTIADANGALAVVQEPVSVNDADGDGQITINDALIIAHDEFYEGGSAEGYTAASSDYGLSIMKLWGSENGGSYGYYVNGASAWSLADPLADGDYLDAFVYTDLESWSDMYTCFDNRVAVGNSIALTLTGAGFDENWNPISVPVVGAEITVDGVRTGIITDENGKAVVDLSNNVGSAIISAVSDTQTIVPPAAVVNTVQAAPQTSDFSVVIAAAAILSLGGIVFAARRKDK